MTAKATSPDERVIRAKRLIGQRLRAIRTSAKRTQEDLASAIGTSRDWVNRLEQGNISQFDSILLACFELDVNPNAVFSDLDKDPEDSRAIYRFIGQFL